VDCGQFLFIGMQNGTIGYEDKRRIVHLNSADVDDIVEIKYEAVGVIYEAVSNWDDLLHRG
jgi:hypothetical protein